MYLNNKINITESKMMRVPIRTIVKDIVEILKLKKVGTFNLPSDSFYSFQNSMSDFSVELYLKKKKKLPLPMITGNYIHEEDVIEIIIFYNPETIEKNLYFVIGELNDILAHELTHMKQGYKGELPSVEPNLTPFEYYTQKHEIESQVEGFKRVSKLTNKNFEDVATQWFETHRDIHNLTKKEEMIIINKLIDFKNGN